MGWEGKEGEEWRCQSTEASAGGRQARGHAGQAAHRGMHAHGNAEGHDGRGAERLEATLAHAHPPAFETAAASSGPDAWFIPARMIGCLMPSSFVMGVSIVCSAIATQCAVPWRQLASTRSSSSKLQAFGRKFKERLDVEGRHFTDLL